jgi:hypothetical protein
MTTTNHTDHPALETQPDPCPDCVEGKITAGCAIDRPLISVDCGRCKGTGALKSKTAGAPLSAAGDKTRFLSRSFTWIENTNTSVRLIDRNDSGSAISIKWSDLEALRTLASLALGDSRSPVAATVNDDEVMRLKAGLLSIEHSAPECECDHDNECCCAVVGEFCGRCWAHCFLRDSPAPSPPSQTLHCSCGAATIVDPSAVAIAAREIAARPSNMPPSAPLSRMKAAFELDCIQIAAIITKHFPSAVSVAGLNYYEQALTVNWGSTNTRRHELITKKAADGLADDEAEEFAELQWLAGIKRELANGPALIAPVVTEEAIDRQR